MKLAWQQIPSTVMSEILCKNQLSGVVIDTEHGCFNMETLFACIQVVTLHKKECFVRITEINKTLIRACLDAGCTGLIFSTVESNEDAKKIHEYCKYPKFEGNRGLGLVRENSWGSGKIDSLISKPPKIVAQIETVKGILNIRSIAKYDFDYYMIGPYDLSASLGIPGEFDNKKYLEAVSKVKKNIPGKRMAVHIPKNIKHELKKYKNYGMIALGMDTTFIIEKYQEVSGYA
jgi:2-dehydro-3-deoxyglucarate aldolase